MRAIALKLCCMPVIIFQLALDNKEDACERSLVKKTYGLCRFVSLTASFKLLAVRETNLQR